MTDPAAVSPLIEQIAHGLGYFSTLTFAVQYLPQTQLNYRRKNVRGFSSLGIIFKLIGAAFLAINGYLTSEPFSVTLYGASNTIQHLVFMFQFAVYPSDEDDRTGNALFLLWFLFPLLPYYLGMYIPETIQFTSYIKPVTQIVSHLPQLAECVRLQTTSGVSLFSQHLNFLGGVCGTYMCFMIKCSPSTTFLYVNSLFQATSIYFLAFWYGEFFDRNFQKAKDFSDH